MEDVIQSVITPLDKALSDFENQVVPTTFKVAKTENHGDYTKYVSFPISDLKEESVRLVRLGEDSSAFAIVGRPKIFNESHIIYKASVMDTPVKLSEDVIETFGDEFYSQLGSLIDSLTGTMSLDMLDNKKKKAAISNSLDAFKIFISAGLDMNAGHTNVALREVMKFEKKDIISEVKSMEVTKTEVEKMDAMETQPGMNTGVPDPVPLYMSEIQNQVFKNQEEMSKLISALAQKVDSLVEAVAKKADPDPVEVDKCESHSEPEVNQAASILKMEEMMTKVVSKVEKLEELVEKIDGDVPEPSAPVETIAKSEQPKVQESPFAGVFDHLKR